MDKAVPMWRLATLMPQKLDDLYIIGLLEYP